MKCTLVLLAADGAANGQMVDLLAEAYHPVPQHVYPAANSSTKVFIDNDINGLVITDSSLREC